MIAIGSYASVRLDRTRDATDENAASIDSLEGGLVEIRQELSTLASRSSTPRPSSLSGLLVPTPLPLTTVAQHLLGSVVTVHAGDSLGSGFIVENRLGERVVVTNHHVIADVWARGLRDVTLVVGEEEYPGTIDRVSMTHDLATIVSEIDLPALDVAADVPMVGSDVVAVGSPYGFEGTLTTGIVSALREDLIQFSAPVSPGNSGGPLTDAFGKVVGVVVAKVSGIDAEGLSFAIPISVVCTTLTSCEGYP